MEDLPYLGHLVFLLKRLLRTNELNISFYGGLSSYCLTLMVTAFLRMRSPLPTPGEYFLDFLRYYWEDFDSSKMEIVNGEGISYFDIPYVSNQPFIMDIFQTEVNAAANVTRFNEIQDLFKKAYKKIISIKDWASPNSDFLKSIVQEKLV